MSPEAATYDALAQKFGLEQEQQGVEILLQFSRQPDAHYFTVANNVFDRFFQFSPEEICTMLTTERPQRLVYPSGNEYNLSFKTKDHTPSDDSRPAAFVTDEGNIAIPAEIERKIAPNSEPADFRTYLENQQAINQRNTRIGLGVSVIESERIHRLLSAGPDNQEYAAALEDFNTQDAAEISRDIEDYSVAIAALLRMYGSSNHLQAVVENSGRVTDIFLTDTLRVQLRAAKVVSYSALQAECEQFLDSACALLPVAE